MIAEHNDTKTEFEFHELSPSAKERAIYKYSESLWDDWHGHVTSEWESDLHEEGFLLPKIMFSGFWSQGDGACFEAHLYFTGDKALRWLKPEDVERVRAHQVRARMDGLPVPEVTISGKIYRSGYYFHENTMQIDAQITFDGNDLDHVYDYLDAAFQFDNDDYPLDAILDYARHLACDIYSDLEKEYEYQTSEEHVAEMSHCNDWKYDEEGNRL